MKILIVVFLFAVCSSACATDKWGQLEDPHLQERYETLTKELRCLQCQNASIADSPVDLAAQLRQKVRELLIAGDSDDQILNYMTDRYGEFVRFRPAVSLKTSFIWASPIFALLLGLFVVTRIMRHRLRQPIDDDFDS